MTEYPEHQITEAGPLLDGQGRLRQAGYSRELLLQYDRRAVKAPSWRIKEWDYYLIYNNSFGLALTLADNGYMGLVSISLLDFDEPWSQTTGIIVPFTRGKWGLPATSARGNAGFANNRCRLAFDNDGRERHLTATMKDFQKGQDLTADITLTEAPRESIVMATPFGKNPKAFYYNQKIIALAARGRVEFKGRTYEFDQGSFGLLDWGRGVWTYENTWYWGAAQGLHQGHVFGFNIGYGFGDNPATENMLFYDGWGHKLAEVDFGIPQTAGADDFLAPWTMTSSDGRFEMVFKPIHDRADRTAVGPLLSDQHQVFGRFSGRAVLDSGKEIKIEDFLGFAEKVHNKW